MPTAYYRDPVSGNYVPILGSMDQAQADARYLKKSGGTMTGALTVPSPTNNTALSTKAKVDVRKIPAGMIIWWAGTALPAQGGWTWCNGTLMKRAEFPDLFAAIGTTYGVGDGVTTFATPNLNGRAIVGYASDNSGYNTPGATGGAKTVTLALSQVPNSSGSYTMHNAGNSTMLYHSTGAMTEHSGTVDYRTGYQNPNIQSRGYAYLNLGFGGGAHDNLQPYIVLKGIIKV